MTPVFSRLAVFIAIGTLLSQPAAAGQPAAQPAPRAQTAGQGPAASTPQAPLPPRSQYDEPNAEETRERLRALLRQHPTTVQEVFKLDPALLTDANYMALYPVLSAFVQAHPEVVRNPRYFLGLPNTLYSDSNSTPRSESARMARDVFSQLFFLIGFMTVAGVVAWFLKTIVEYRRWLRLTKVQTEAHTKLVDRLTTNEDLLGYIQSPAGRRFLEAGPVAVESPKSMAAPYGRILWSIQAGTVVTLLGGGLLLVSRRLGADPEMLDASPFMFMLGTIAVAIGFGFILSAFMSYMVSRRLGLLEATSSSHA